MRIRLSSEQVEAIRAAVAQATPRPEQAKPEQTTGVAARPHHLSDAEFLTLCVRGEATADQLGQEARDHLAQCLECSAEWERLQELGAIWQDPATRERLTARREAALRGGGPAFIPSAGRPRNFLGALIPMQAAYAAQAVPDPESIPFPVYEAGAPVSGLSATLRRRNHEVFALVAPLDADATALYGERTALLTIADEENQHPILTREIAVGVATLLGTHLPLSATSYVQADLVP